MLKLRQKARVIILAFATLNSIQALALETKQDILDYFHKQALAAVNSAQSLAPSGLTSSAKESLNNYLSAQKNHAQKLCNNASDKQAKKQKLSKTLQDLFDLSNEELKEVCLKELTKFANSLASNIANIKAGTGSDQILDDMNLKVSPTDTNSMSVPDAQNEWIGAGYVPMESPPTFYLSAKTPNEKARAYHAEMLERTVRVFISGSKQLFLDKGVNYGGTDAKEVKGMYQGYMPDLVNSTKEIQVTGPFMPEWGECALGIANEENDTQKWFKSPSGTYEKERIEKGKLTSHQCQGIQNSTMGASGQAPLIRGKIVNALLLFLKKMQTEMIIQGKFVTASGYGLKEPEGCTKIATEINVMRERLRDIRNDITQGMEKDQQANALACVATQNGSAVKLNGKTLEGATARGCIYDTMQTLTENKNVGLYAYCTWSTVASEIIARMSKVGL